MKIEQETKYDIGDIVVFTKDNHPIQCYMAIGKIKGVYFDCQTFWYDITISKDVTFKYGNYGDVGEDNIRFKVTDERMIKEFEKFIEEENEED